MEHDVAATEDVLAEIRRVHGLELTARRRFAAGLQGGAWLVADARDRPVVLKWNRHDSAARMRQRSAAVGRARAAGYPTPAWLAAGATEDGFAYCVQEFVPGEPSTPLTPAKTALLLEVLDTQAGLDPDPATDRSVEVAAAAVADRPRQVLNELGAPGRALIRRYDELLAGYGPVGLPGGDLAHGDFNSCNILLREGRVSGVIDLDGLGSGTRVIDYACLLRECYVEGYGSAVSARIHRAAEAVAGPAVLAVCATVAAFFIVEFKLRHEPAAVPEVLSHLDQLAIDLAS
ncbi:MAG TPA: phosphotransferase [Mycobacteriales bacterium]|jgi:Ser/Thr protein kinase RdoA (MazF antagonist)|nr:phosphotransferase [Mycobacteriales bacterium]